ncbi:Elongation of very long chain fatty acids protein 7 [Tyrophagus putrescentiae]|nr:Elongation of very long chain fatty acids protein 7 [Tyrophagus putrescentiae]
MTAMLGAESVVGASSSSLALDSVDSNGGSGGSNLLMQLGTSEYWDSTCDPRAVHFWLMSGGPWKLLALTAAYIAIVVFGSRLMRGQAPLELRTPMLVYNVLMVAINGYFLYEALTWIGFGARLLDFRFPSPADRSPEAMRIVNSFNLYFWTKFVDYFDTFFFILRKKNRQVTTLHIYHHISVPIIGWISSWISPTMPVLGLLHCPYLWWKKYITQIQLIQFAIIGLYGLCLNLLHSGYPLIYRMMPVSQALIFLVMFGQFYVRSYLSSKQIKKSQ